MTAYATFDPYFSNGASVTNSIVTKTKPTFTNILQSNQSAGANIVYQRGKSGTLYGEPGWNDYQTALFMPFPYQDFIHDLFASADTGQPKIDNPSNNPKRGFAADGMTLEKYVVGFNGGTVTPGPTPPPPPVPEPPPPPPPTPVPCVPVPCSPVPCTPAPCTISIQGTLMINGVNYKLIEQ